MARWNTRFQNFFKSFGRSSQGSPPSCDNENNKINELQNQINSLNDNINQLQSTINDNNNKINTISSLLNEANSTLQLTQQQLNDALIIVAKYNVLYPKYLQLQSDYNALLIQYNQTLAELAESKYMLALTDDTLGLSTNVIRYTNYQNTLNKSRIEGFTGTSDNYTNGTYVGIKNQNNILKTQVDKVNNIYSADNQRVIYQSANVNFLSRINAYMFGIYYFFLCVVAYLLAFSIKNIPRNFKILIVVLFAIYPVVMYQLERYVYFVVTYILSLFSGNVFFQDY